MKKKAIRPKPRIKAWTFSPKCRLGRWGGYRAWAEYMAQFTRYVQVAMDGHHDDWSTQQGGDLNPEVQAYALGDADLCNLVDPQRLVVGPARPEAPRHLYALDADDLLEFTAEDVLAAWTLRTQCCGTKEVAAELYALFRVLNGDDDSYAGPAAYLDDQMVLAMFPVPESQEQAVRAELSSSGAAIGSVDAPEPEVEVAQEMASGLTLAEVRGLTIEPLKAAWGNRPESFASLEAAAETLAILRSLNSKATEKPSYRVMMEHDLVQDLVDSLPLEIAHNAPAPAVELELLRRDQRVVRTQAAVVRPRQGNFRTSLFQRYGGACCITGCKVDTLLEAAHIIPYRGDQTDDVSNGLLLRVDLHRLFDAHLVTINPVTFEVEVTSTIEDEGYRAYHGKRLFRFSPKPRVLFLETHYAAYQRVAGDRL